MQQQQPPRPSAAAPAPASQQQQQKVFDALHGELVAEARGVARELGVDVQAVVFRPDDAGAAGQPRAVAHLIRGRVATVEEEEARARRRGVRELVARDVSAMGAAELAQHARRLQALRAAVVRELRGKEKAEEDADVDDEGVVERKAGDARRRRQQYQEAGRVLAQRPATEMLGLAASGHT